MKEKIEYLLNKQVNKIPKKIKKFLEKSYNNMKNHENK
jgi:hypothetical protein